MSSISAAECRTAEARFAQVLEEVFGGPEGVWRRYEAARQSLAAARGGELPADDKRNIARWQEASSVAAQLALGGLPPGQASQAVFSIERIG